MNESLQNRLRQTAATLVALTLVLSVVGPVGTAVAAPGVTVSQTADSASVTPGDNVTVTTEFTVTELNSPQLSTSTPDGWTVESQSAEGPAAFSDGTWTWLAGDDDGVNVSYTVEYTVDVPADASPGDYTVDAEGSALSPGDSSRTAANDPLTVTVVKEETNTPPTASITGPSSAAVGSQVTFDASAADTDGSIESYEWDFGDGETATGQSVDHTFGSAGDYTVELTVIDNDGATAQATQTVTVDAAPEPASFQVSALTVPSSVTQGETATVTATLQNTGDEQATQSVSLAVDGSQVDSQSLTLAGDASQQVSFDLDTSGLAAAQHAVAISSEDDSASGTTTVEAAADPSPGDVAVSLEPSNQTAATGDEVTYDVVVTGADDVGSFEGTVTLTDTTSATITNVSTPASSGTENIDIDGQSAQVEVFGLPTDTNGPVTVATITVSADEVGATNLSLSDAFVSDVAGNGYTIDSTSGGSLTVGLTPVVGDSTPTNLDDDPVLEDVNGDGQFNVGDAQALFYNQDSPVVENNVDRFDFNDDGQINVGDAQAAFYQAVISES
ncbi:PKD domain-containing protein [Haloarcula sp. Atlit-7R]|uniref:PKD domain-containing protein n=1 Tax=Haloarcula sp. Atlit-7R TaxID=2282125 RepID=UPI000EF14A14|nr:PKD domain-containing protein [Haloarcula sp. Atlit-7R]RLM95294.1 PKD domain-containing protein [Haloarcula sp. Atlit-7R]